MSEAKALFYQAIQHCPGAKVSEANITAYMHVVYVLVRNTGGVWYTHRVIQCSILQENVPQMKSYLHCPCCCTSSGMKALRTTQSMPCLLYLYALFDLTSMPCLTSPLQH